jgi:hypothetical protein
MSCLQVLEQILQQRLVARGRKYVMHVLVKWSSLPAMLATWEDLEALKQSFPAALTWGQAAYKGRGSVRTTAAPDMMPGVQEEPTKMGRERIHLCNKLSTAIIHLWFLPSSVLLPLNPLAVLPSPIPI